MLDEVTRGEIAEKELDAFIGRRALKRDPEQERIEEDWRKSCEAVANRKDRETTACWYAYHMDQAARLRRTMTALIERHEAKAAALLEGGP